MAGAAPVLRLALAFALGAAWADVGAPLGLAPLAALLLLAAPKSTSSGPEWRPWWAVASLAGVAAALAVGGVEGACRPADFDAPTVVEGRFLASPTTGSAPFVSVAACGPFTVVVGGRAAAPRGGPGAPEADAHLRAGVAVRLVGVWREGRQRPWFLARAGTVTGEGTEGWRWRAVGWRDGVVRRIERLYGERAPLVSALTLARREGLDPDLRETFARVGIAHLLAISGFHVGVIAGVLLIVMISARVETRRAGLASASASWVYVGLIGFPDAACRAALILTAAALSRARGRPAAKWGAIGSALLVLLALDPRRLVEPGFQLSFAGAAGLTAWAGTLSRSLARLGGRACPRSLALAVAAGLAATIATLPVVAWHFERVSLVGIPVTLVATPLVTLGLIGSLASIGLDFVAPPLASLLAGGVGAVLGGLESLARLAGGLPWASVWTSRGTVVGGVAGAALARWLSRRPRVGRRARRTLTGVYVAAGVLVWPLLLTLQGRGTAEILMIDVGQGDAIGLRGTDGRWMLVDAGPVGDAGEDSAHPVVRALRSRGVRRLEALVLTHPDLDHIGGAAAVLRSFDVGVVYDPGLPAGKQGFVDVLEVATSRGVPWRAARAGDRVDLGGLAVRVLHPTDSLAPDVESNASSVVLHAGLGAFDVLLTGDAYKDVDRLLAPGFTDVLEVLKVGHHGSDTSTDPELLDAARPELALVSVGRFNRYGHPAPEVLRRLEERGIAVRRTDREGDITVLGRRDGGYSVRSRR